MGLATLSGSSNPSRTVICNTYNHDKDWKKFNCEKSIRHQNNCRKWEKIYNLCKLNLIVHIWLFITSGNFSDAVLAIFFDQIRWKSSKVFLHLSLVYFNHEKEVHFIILEKLYWSFVAVEMYFLSLSFQNLHPFFGFHILRKINGLFVITLWLRFLCVLELHSQKKEHETE